MRDLGLRVLAFLAFVLLLGGSTWAAYTYLQVRDAELEPLAADYAVSPGKTFAIPFVVTNRGSVAETLGVVVDDDAGLALSVEPATSALGAFDRAAGWFEVALPSHVQPGDYRIRLAAEAADGARLASADVDITVLAPGQGLAPGEQAAVRYVGRYPGGVVFDTNVRAIAEGSWPKAADFRRHETWEPFVVRAGAASEVIPGFSGALVGLQPGETVTVVVPPERAYGPEFHTEEVPREVEIQRNRTVPLQDFSIQRQRFAQHISSTGQGDPEAFGPGDPFVIQDEHNEYRAVVTDVTPTVVRYRFDMREGERYTLYPFWPEGSVVAFVNETQLSFQTTPTTEPGARFTYFPPWEGRTSVARVEDDVVVLRHDVDVGLEYDAATAPNLPPTAYRVREVREEVIVVETRNPAPLAGRTLVFDITRVAP